MSPAWEVGALTRMQKTLNSECGLSYLAFTFHIFSLPLPPSGWHIDRDRIFVGLGCCARSLSGLPQQTQLVTPTEINVVLTAVWCQKRLNIFILWDIHTSSPMIVTLGKLFDRDAHILFWTSLSASVCRSSAPVYAKSNGYKNMSKQANHFTILSYNINCSLLKSCL